MTRSAAELFALLPPDEQLRRILPSPKGLPMTTQEPVRSVKIKSSQLTAFDRYQAVQEQARSKLEELPEETDRAEVRKGAEAALRRLWSRLKPDEQTAILKQDGAAAVVTPERRPVPQAVRIARQLAAFPYAPDPASIPRAPRRRIVAPRPTESGEERQATTPPLAPDPVASFRRLAAEADTARLAGELTRNCWEEYEEAIARRLARVVDLDTRRELLAEWRTELLRPEFERIRPEEERLIDRLEGFFQAQAHKTGAGVYGRKVVVWQALRELLSHFVWRPLSGKELSAKTDPHVRMENCRIVRQQLWDAGVLERRVFQAVGSERAETQYRLADTEGLRRALLRFQAC